MGIHFYQLGGNKPEPIHGNVQRNDRGDGHVYWKRFRVGCCGQLSWTAGIAYRAAMSMNLDGPSLLVLDYQRYLT